MPDFDLTKLLTAVAGAFVSMIKWPGSLIEKGVMGAAGVLISYVTSDWVAAQVGVPPGVAGFVLGLFGMSIVGKVWDMVNAVDAARVVADLWAAVIERIKR